MTIAIGILSALALVAIVGGTLYALVMLAWLGFFRVGREPSLPQQERVEDVEREADDAYWRDEHEAWSARE